MRKLFGFSLLVLGLVAPVQVSAEGDSGVIIDWPPSYTLPSCPNVVCPCNAWSQTCLQEATTTFTNAVAAAAAERAAANLYAWADYFYLEGELVSEREAQFQQHASDRAFCDCCFSCDPLSFTSCVEETWFAQCYNMPHEGNCSSLVQDACYFHYPSPSSPGLCVWPENQVYCGVIMQILNNATTEWYNTQHNTIVDIRDARIQAAADTYRDKLLSEGNAYCIKKQSCCASCVGNDG